MTADYPDWDDPQAHATAISITGVPLLRNITVLSTTAVCPAGAISGPFTQQYSPFYEGYLLEVIPQHPSSDIFAVDLAISHIDSSGHTIAVEEATVSNWDGAGADTAILRGRLLGTELSITAQVAASSWINTVTGGAVTADSVTIRFCGLQTYVPGTGKRIPTVSAWGGLLQGTSSTVSLPGTVGTVVQIGVLPDYTGQVFVSGATGAGGGFSFSPRINSYTVSNGTGVLSEMDFPSIVSGTPLNQAAALPSCFNVAYAVQRSSTAGSAGFAVTVASPDQ